MARAGRPEVAAAQGGQRREVGEVQVDDGVADGPSLGRGRGVPPRGGERVVERRVLGPQVVGQTRQQAQATVQVSVPVSSAPSIASLSSLAPARAVSSCSAISRS